MRPAAVGGTGIGEMPMLEPGCCGPDTQWTTSERQVVLLFVGRRLRRLSSGGRLLTWCACVRWAVAAAWTRGLAELARFVDQAEFDETGGDRTGGAAFFYFGGLTLPQTVQRRSSRWTAPCPTPAMRTIWRR